MSGNCEFCQTWHSGPCCHPARFQYDLLQNQLATMTAERNVFIHKFKVESAHISDPCI